MSTPLAELMVSLAVCSKRQEVGNVRTTVGLEVILVIKTHWNPSARSGQNI